MTPLRILVIRIKSERIIVRNFITAYNDMRNKNPRDGRLKGFSHAINLHKQIVDNLQHEIDVLNEGRRV